MFQIKNLRFVFVLVVLSVYSCNNKAAQLKLEKSLLKSLKKSLSNEDIKNYYEVKINFLAEKDDNFQLFYTEDYLLSFSEKQSIRKDFKGKKEFQEIIFGLPENVFPDRFRIDLGSNKEQSFIKINTITFSYKHRAIVIPKHLISTLFVFNNQVSFNKNKKELHLTNGSIHSDKIYDPYLTCSPQLVRMLFDL
ncbi:hypothetical protein E1J38_004205 [Seonamhaeicola sediminis]|uniref:Lipoprotein n=1 Tax=Seonamhaeicola sediminis TaxID=2528206 RepID=A0A562YHJ4_9FLAO|nr:hypothetical protein [Seonamhaeicola sediminis]TWO33986.1 hypothetical protein E1J38_004205 [Seonamhaeicola sediminis]